MDSFSIGLRYFCWIGQELGTKKKISPLSNMPTEVMLWIQNIDCNPVLISSPLSREHSTASIILDVC